MTDSSTPTQSAPRWRTIDVPLFAFETRLKQLSPVANSAEAQSRASMHSRLALVHQTAKAFAVEAAQQSGCPNPVVDIDELTNPPLLDLPIDPDDEQTVTIRFSYQPGDSSETAEAS